MQRLTSCLSLLLLASLWLAAHPPTAAACSCTEWSTSEAFAESRAVFTGELISLTPLGPYAPTHFGSRQYLAHFQVHRGWKGIDSAEVALLAREGGSLCSSIPFEVRETYIVWAYDRDGQLVIDNGGCGGTQTIYGELPGNMRLVLERGRPPPWMSGMFAAMMGSGLLVLAIASVWKFGGRRLPPAYVVGMGLLLGLGSGGLSAYLEYWAQPTHWPPHTLGLVALLPPLLGLLLATRTLSLGPHWKALPLTTLALFGAFGLRLLEQRPF